MDVKKKLLIAKREEINQNWIDWLTKGEHIEVFEDILDQVDFGNPSYYRMVTDSLEQAAVAADSTT